MTITPRQQTQICTPEEKFKLFTGTLAQNTPNPKCLKLKGSAFLFAFFEEK